MLLYISKKQQNYNFDKKTALIDELLKATKGGAWGFLKSPIDGQPLDTSRLKFGACIGCGWLQVLLHLTSNPHGAKWGFNTYLKQEPENRRAVLGSYNGGKSWDIETYAESKAEGLADLKAYDENGGGLYILRLIKCWE